MTADTLYGGVGVHKVIEFRGRIADMSAGQFRHRFPHPVLVAQEVMQGELLRPATRQAPEPAPASRRFGQRPARAARVASNTSVYAGGTMMLALPEGMLLGPEMDAASFPCKRLSNDLFVWLAHRNQNSPRSPVTIGRTSRCDVVVNDFTVSNEHAWIVRSPGVRRFFIVDRGSTNGTRVDDAVIPAKVRAALTSGCEVTIGRVSFTYLEPLDFYRRIMGADAPQTRSAATAERRRVS